MKNKRVRDDVAGKLGITGNIAPKWSPKSSKFPNSASRLFLIRGSDIN